MPFLADVVLFFVAADRIPNHLTSYISGKTPLTTWPAVLSMGVTYLAIAFGTREIMKDKAPMELTTLFRAHNLILSVGSLILMALIGEEVFANWLKPEIGTYGVLCASSAFTQRLESYLVLAYFMRYYEFVDTIFLALKKKPISFLHVYHHAAAVLLGYVGLNERPTVAWVTVFLNLGVHVFLYYYYFATAGGAKIWWKKYLITMEIVQFMIILVSGIFASYHYIAYNWFPEYLPHGGGCTGTPTVAVVGSGVILSYLHLFLDFFSKTYLPKAGSKDFATFRWFRLLSFALALICMCLNLLFVMRWVFISDTFHVILRLLTSSL